jgi:DNA-binding response OmpR family regulator
MSSLVFLLCAVTGIHCAAQSSKMTVLLGPQWSEVRMATTRSCSRSARFDRFEVDLVAGELRKSGQLIALQDQPFQILRLLIEAVPGIVTHEQISSVLWPSNTFVDFDLAINTAIRKTAPGPEISPSSFRHSQRKGTCSSRTSISSET